MRRGMSSRGFAAFAGTMVVAGPVMTACASEPSYEDWAATDGAAGRINLDDVQDAFKKSESVTEFEDRVNRIYEGDGVVLIRVEQDGDVMTLEAFEDLDGNGEISDSADDQIFSIVKDHDRHEMRGYGANGYYHHGFGAGDFLFTYLLLSTFVGPRYSYYTPPARATTIRSDRSTYRRLGVLPEPGLAQRQLLQPAEEVPRVEVRQRGPQYQPGTADLSGVPEVERSVQDERDQRQERVAFRRRTDGRRRCPDRHRLRSVNRRDPFEIEIRLDGLPHDAVLCLELSPGLAALTVGDMLVEVFRGHEAPPFADAELRDNPDLPDLFAQFAGLFERWVEGVATLRLHRPGG